MIQPADSAVAGTRVTLFTNPIFLSWSRGSHHLQVTPHLLYALTTVQFGPTALVPRRREALQASYSFLALSLLVNQVG